VPKRGGHLSFLPHKLTSAWCKAEAQPKTFGCSRTVSEFGIHTMTDKLTKATKAMQSGKILFSYKYLIYKIKLLKILEIIGYLQIQFYVFFYARKYEPK
jgi:hypothetical protein